MDINCFNWVSIDKFMKLNSIYLLIFQYKCIAINELFFDAQKVFKYNQIYTILLITNWIKFKN